MTYRPLPARPNPEWLKKRAKARLMKMREMAPDRRLYEAQLEIAREHGFTSWRALRAHVDRVNGEGRFHADGTPAHLPSQDVIAGWPDFSPEAPLRVLVSGCLAGLPVGIEGKPYGEFPHIRKLLGLTNVTAVSFCPEHYAFGTPRECPDIEGGDGYDVLDGRARVVSSTGADWTSGMLDAARRMLALAQAQGVRLAILQDISAACGSQVIYRGRRRAGAPHQIGVGVCTALLIRHSIAVVSQRDFKTLGLIRAKLDPSHSPDPALRNHHEIDWYREYFQAGWI